MNHTHTQTHTYRRAEGAAWGQREQPQSQPVTFRVCCLSLSFFNEFPPKKTKEQTELFRMTATATETQTQTWSEGGQQHTHTITHTCTDTQTHMHNNKSPIPAAQAQRKATIKIG